MTEETTRQREQGSGYSDPDPDPPFYNNVSQSHHDQEGNNGNEHNDGSNRTSSSLRRRRRPPSGTSSSRNTYRILDRDAPLGQSKGKWNVRHINQFSAHRGSTSGAGASTRSTRGYLCPQMNTTKAKFYFWADWFHSAIYSPTHRVFLYIFCVYTSAVLMFGGLYYSVSKYAYKIFPQTRTNTSFCNMDIHNIMEAMYFSLSTMTTIGYGVSDYYFGDCWLPFILVLMQVFCAMTIDAVAVGIIFQRLSRGRKRGRTVIFSDQAVIRRINGELYFMFRMGELLKRHLMECHVRVYCIRHERCKVVQVTKPDTTSSTTMPSNHNNNNNNTRHDSSILTKKNEVTSLSCDNCTSTTRTSPAEDFLRQPLLSSTTLEKPNEEFERKVCSSNDDNDNAEDASTRIETNHFQVHTMRLQHPNDTLGGMLLMVLPSMIVHKIDKHSPLVPSPNEPWYDVHGNEHSSSLFNQENVESTLQPFFQDRELEIVVVVEGIDEMTSSSLQAKHSYKVEDIMFGYQFVPCIIEGHKQSQQERQRNDDDDDDVDDADNDNMMQSSPNNNNGCCDGSWFQRLFSRNWFQTTTERRQNGNRRRRGPTGGLDCCIVDFDQFHKIIPAPYDCNACPYITT